MYHFFSPADGAPAASPPSAVSAAAASRSWGSGFPTLPIDQIRKTRPREIEQEQDDRRDDRHRDDDEGRRAHFLRGGPGDLLQLARDFIGEVIDAIVAVQADADDDSDDAGSQRHLELARRSA